MPIAVVEFAKIDPELTKRLGQIAINWALIEDGLDTCSARLSMQIWAGPMY